MVLVLQWAKVDLSTTPLIASVTSSLIKGNSHLITTKATHSVSQQEHGQEFAREGEMSGVPITSTYLAYGGGLPRFQSPKWQYWC